MKILSVNNTADIYGASRCMERVFGRLSEEGNEIHAVLPERGALADMLEARGVRVHVHRNLTVIDRATLRTFWGCIRFLLLFPVSVITIVVLIVRLQIDVVHTNTVVMPSPSIAAWITNRPHLWHVRELLGEFGWLWKPYQRYVHSFSSTIIAISCCTRDQFEPPFRGKVQVIYDGLDETAAMQDLANSRTFRALLPPGKKLVGVVGRIKWHRKGQEVLVRAASLLREQYPDVHYVLVGKVSPGNEDHEDRLRELISSCGLDDAITLVGEITDTASVFGSLDIAVAPSIQAEPFGCVVIEAMAAGAVVIGSRCGGIAEQILDNETGFLFPPGDAEALATVLKQLLDDPELRKRMAQKGLLRVRSTFQLDHTCRAMAQLIGSAVDPVRKKSISKTCIKSKEHR